MIMDLESGNGSGVGLPTESVSACSFCGALAANDSSSTSFLSSCSKCGRGLWFSLNQHGDCTVINPLRPTLLPDDLDKLIDVVTRMEHLRLEMNLGGVQTIPSPVLAKLLNLKSIVRFGGGTFALVNLKPDLFKIFELTRLNEVFEIR